MKSTHSKCFVDYVRCKKGTLTAYSCTKVIFFMIFNYFNYVFQGRFKSL